MSQLTQQEYRRYLRHLMLQQVGEQGQLQLKKAKVIVIGAGGLGCPILMYLAAAGIGHIAIIDHDVVEESNLQRQVLYNSNELGQPKSVVAAKKIQAQNPLINVETFREKFTAKNHHLLRNYDIVIDGSDNFATRYLVSDACVKFTKPLVYGSIFRFEGQVSLFSTTKDTPCYRCLYPQMPAKNAIPDCSQAGVLGVLPGMIAMFQATETLKHILQIGESLSGKLLCFNALDLEMRKLNIKKNPQCQACGIAQIDIENYTYTTEEVFTNEISSTALRQKKESVLLIDVRREYEHHAQHIANSVLIPLDELPQNPPQCDKQHPIVVYCKSGHRSQKALRILQEQGFVNVESLTGGIDAWFAN